MGKLYSIMRQGEVPPDIPDVEQAEKVMDICDPQKMMAGE